MIIHHINNREFKEALDIVSTIKDDTKKNLLMVRYSSFFLMNEAKYAIECLLSSFPTLNANLLTQSLMSVDIANRLYAIDYFKFILKQANDNTLYNLYFFFLCQSNNPKTNEMLLSFLDEQGKLYNQGLPLNVDKEFAMNLLKYFGKIEAQAKMLSIQGLYRAAVKLAIEAGKLDLAKYIAKEPKDAELKKELWLKIIKVAAEKDPNCIGLEIIEESQNAVLLSDILPFISPSMKIKCLRENILKQLEKNEVKAKELKSLLHNYHLSSEGIREEIEELKCQYTVINPDKYCDHCNTALIGTEKFYVFPCFHVVHRVLFLFYTIIELFG